MKIALNLFFLLILSQLVSCAMLEHRDFENQMDSLHADDSLFVPNRDFAVVPGDEGRFYRDNTEILQRTPATQKVQARDLFRNSLKRELFGLESRLDDAEYQEYLKIRDKLGNDSEKIYYLQLSARKRMEYLKVRQIEAPHYYTIRESQMASFNQDVVLGMRKSDVVQSWGEPDRRDFAGDPRYQNERWAYSRNGQVKYIYFEGGLVGGWTEQ